METSVRAAPETTLVAPRGHLAVQRVLGLFCYLLFVLPYARRIRGLASLSRERRLFVCNHVSLLDTILLGGVFWSRARLPILVLGDAGVWRGSGLRSFLSSRVGFLIERGRSDRELIRRLREFGQARKDFNLIVFPEGTRGDGIKVAECQPGLYTIAHAARIPIVPIFISGMQKVSSKTIPFHPISGLRSVSVEFGAELAPEDYLQLDRLAFAERVRERIQALGNSAEAERR